MVDCSNVLVYTLTHTFGIFVSNLMSLIKVIEERLCRENGINGDLVLPTLDNDILLKVRIIESNTGDLSSVFDYFSYTDIPPIFSSVYIRRRPYHNHQ